MIEPLIESTLSALFDFLKKKVISSPSDRTKFDFVIKEDDGSKVGIEVKSNANLKFFRNTIDFLLESGDISKFYLITPEKPDERAKRAVENLFQKNGLEFRWYGINDFINEQGWGLELSEDLKKSLYKLQIAAVTSNYDSYSPSHIGPDLGQDNPVKQLKKNYDEVRESKSAERDLLFELKRQFPYYTISKLQEHPEKLSESLSFGKKYDDAIIILSDIKNFSTIVSVSDPEELNELMGKYYSNARELVFKYGGILDKFIGDAVLAIFNYPEKSSDNFRKAAEFCAELILMGETLLNNFQKKLDNAIATGTRVGVANGPIYPLNIGKDEVEVTFIGDKINFAARLEKNSPINGILLSNRFYNKLIETTVGEQDRFIVEEVKLDENDAKGQIGTTTAWKILPENVAAIIE